MLPRAQILHVLNYTGDANDWIQ